MQQPRENPMWQALVALRPLSRFLAGAVFTTLLDTLAELDIFYWILGNSVLVDIALYYFMGLVFECMGRAYLDPVLVRGFRRPPPAGPERQLTRQLTTFVAGFFYLLVSVLGMLFSYFYGDRVRYVLFLLFVLVTFIQVLSREYRQDAPMESHDGGSAEGPVDLTAGYGGDVAAKHSADGCEESQQIPNEKE